MSESIVKITNPLPYMTKSYIKEKLSLMGFGEDMVKIRVITKNQIPIEIELEFPFPELAQKFIKMTNNKSIDEFTK